MCPEYFFSVFFVFYFSSTGMICNIKDVKKVFRRKNRTTSVMISKDPVNHLELQKNTQIFQKLNYFVKGITQTKNTYVQDRSCQQKFASKFFRNCRKLRKNYVRKSLTNIAKIAKITNLTRINGKQKRGIVFFMNFKFYFFSPSPCGPYGFHARLLKT